MHVRQQIREAVATALTGLDTTGARVYQSRLHALRNANLPCLLVQTDNEDIASLSIAETPPLQRELRVRISGVDKTAENLDDTLDDICAEVEAEMGSQTSLGGKCHRIELEKIGIRMSDDLEQPVGIIELTYRITYVTAADDAETAL